MHVYVYSDESGVLDKAHNDFFVFGGLILLSKEEKDIVSRKFISLEKAVKRAEKLNKQDEPKACKISNRSKRKLYSSLNSCYKFGAVVEQSKILDRIFDCKKSKQRYLDYVYKVALKTALQNLIEIGALNANDPIELHIFVDEHSTATNGRYELREAIEQELKIGSFNYNWNAFHPPLFENLKSIDLKFCNSSSNALIRAADIISNRIFFETNRSLDFSALQICIRRFP